MATRKRVCLGNAAHLGPFEEHHIAGRANDASLTVWLCVRCHRETTRWQYRLGMLHSAPRSHPETERDWARVTGGAIVLAVAAPPEIGASLVSLGLAAGLFYALVAESKGIQVQWGPRPAWQRRTDSAPRSIGPGPVDASLRLASDLGRTLAPEDSRWAALASVGSSATPVLEGLPNVGDLQGGSQLVADATLMEQTLARMARAANVDEFGATRGDREAALAAGSRAVDALLAMVQATSESEALGAFAGVYDAER